MRMCSPNRQSTRGRECGSPPHPPHCHHTSHQGRRRRPASWKPGLPQLPPQGWERGRGPGGRAGSVVGALAAATGSGTGAGSVAGTLAAAAGSVAGPTAGTARAGPYHGCCSWLAHASPTPICPCMLRPCWPIPPHTHAHAAPIWPTPTLMLRPRLPLRPLQMDSFTSAPPTPRSTG